MMPLALQDFGTTFLGKKTLAATNEEHLMKEKPSIQTTKKKSYSRLQAKIFKTTQQQVSRFPGNGSINFINFLTSKLIYAHLLKNKSEKIQQNQLFKSNFSAESNYLLPSI